MGPDDDLYGDVGPLDVVALESVQLVFRGDDGLVDSTQSAFDSVIDPTRLRVRFQDGIGDAEWARFDIKWYRSGFYNFHHVDGNDVQFRFDYHPKNGANERHYHPPPDAPSDPDLVEKSCITAAEPDVVARAVLGLWRRAYDEDDFSQLNTATNPP